VNELITHRIPLEDAAAAYGKLLHNPSALGIVIEYPGGQGDVIPSPIPTSTKKSKDVRLIVHGDGEFAAQGKAQVGVIGAGNYARATLLPALSRTNATLVTVADINGVAAAHAARKFGAVRAVSDYLQILDDPNIQAVFVLVGHHLHARFVREVLEAGKHVFVEKPLAINENQLQEILSIYPSPLTSHPSRIHLMVGFNRRFSPHTVKMRELLASRTEPLTMSMTINAGAIPPEHWTQDPERGGGRIIGEGCHFIDLLAFLANSRVASVSAMMIGGSGPVWDDKMSILLGFADGSVGTVHYFANGSKSYPKETLEIFGDGRVIRMENFRVTTGYGFKGFRTFRTWRQDKGHRAEIAAFIKAVGENAPSLIPFDEIVNVTRASFAAVESAKREASIKLDGLL
jgi:predicted dehydrogenase